MKYVIGLLALVFSANVYATVDGHDRIFLVVTHVQDETEFFLERAPIVGCYGLAQGARLVAFTSEYKVPTNIGCGGVAGTENINSLSCATLVDAIESDDYMSFKKITLNISKCPAKDDARFITMVRTAAARNFPQSNKSKEVELVLIK